MDQVQGAFCRFSRGGSRISSLLRRPPAPERHRRERALIVLPKQGSEVVDLLEGGGVGERHLSPLDAQQPVPAPRALQLGGIDRAQGERADRGERRSVAIGDGEGDSLPGGRGELHPQLARPPTVQGDPIPGEGQLDLRLGAGLAVESGRVQGGVEQGGMDDEAVSRFRLLARQRDLGVDRLALAPGGAEALEDGAVAEPCLGQAVVEELHLDRLRALRGPGLDRLWRRLGLGRERAAGVAGPLALLRRVALGAGVDRQLAQAQLVGARDRYSHLHRALIGKEERRLEGKLLDPLGVHLLPRPQRQLQEAGAGEEDVAGDRVILQPGLGLQGEAAGEDESAPLGVIDHRAQQRVLRCLLSGGADIPRALARDEPVALAAEWVGRQRHPPGAGAGEEGLPVELCA